jgi:hypothetical protein
VNARAWALCVAAWQAGLYPAATPAAFDPEACPGCGCMPGDGRTYGCADPDGCGFMNAHVYNTSNPLED